MNCRLARLGLAVAFVLRRGSVLGLSPKRRPSPSGDDRHLKNTTSPVGSDEVTHSPPTNSA